MPLLFLQKNADDNASKPAVLGRTDGSKPAIHRSWGQSNAKWIFLGFFVQQHPALLDQEQLDVHILISN